MPSLPLLTHEVHTSLLEKRFLEAIGDSPLSESEADFAFVALDALARAAAAMISDARDYHQALDQFRAYLDTALMAGDSFVRRTRHRQPKDQPRSQAQE
jgi:hypothetical protein